MVDEDSGETIGMFPLKQKTLGKGWLALYQSSAEWLATLHLSGEQYRVLLCILGRLDFDNYLWISNKEIADVLNMRPGQVSRAMGRLKELGIVVANSGTGKYFKSYRLNPDLVHKGANRHQTLAEFKALMATNAVDKA